MRPSWLALAALFWVPGASACSWATPEPLGGLDWPAEELLLGTTELFWKGHVDLDAGIARSEFPSDALLSPDLRYAVFPRTGPDIQMGPTVMQDSCGFHLSRHLVAYDRGQDAFTLVARGPVWGLAATDEGVFAFDGDTVRVLEWGSWVELRAGPAPDVVEPLSFRSWIALSPDGRAYLDWEQSALVDLDGTKTRPLAADATRLLRVEFSPNTELVATEVELDAATHELRIHRVSDMAVVARETLPAAVREYDWGPRGLAWVESRIAEIPSTASLHVWPGAPAEAAHLHRSLATPTASLAWSASGDALAISLPGSGMQARVLVLDARLETLRDADVRIERGEPAAWSEAVAAQVPIPEYSAVERLRATSMSTPLVGIVIAFLLSRRGRGTSKAPRP